jgi:hypothetical protein
MKKLKLTKLLAGTLLITSFLALSPIAANAEWKNNSKGWFYTEGNSVATGWRLIKGNLYFFESNGYMMSNDRTRFFDSEYGLNSDGQFTNVTISGDWAFCKQTGKIVTYLGSETNINIPDKIDNIPVTGIGAYAFRSPKITNVTIPNTVTIISYNAFSGCTNLTDIKIPNSVKSIYDHAFTDCWKLKSITIPGSVVTLGNNIFNRCYSLTDVTIENGVRSLGNGTFTSCVKLTNITLPATINFIGESTFEGCMSLKSIVIPNGVTNICNNTFNYCYSLTDITIPNGVTSIGMGAFNHCKNLNTITIPNSVQNIKTQENGPNYEVIRVTPFEGSNKVKIYVKSEATKQLLVNSGVSADKINVTA